VLSRVPFQPMARDRTSGCDDHAFARDPIDIGGWRAHYAAIVSTDVEPAHIIGENKEDVGLYSAAMNLTSVQRIARLKHRA
jgi:hypothetical protein